MSTHNGKSDWTVVRGVLLRIKNIIDIIRSWIHWINQNREGKHSAAFIAWCIAFLSVAILSLMLFVPRYIGMSDDGSFARFAGPVGIYHLEDIDENLYFNYYVKDYLSLPAPLGSFTGYMSSQRFFIIIAKWMDTFFTHDNHFDLRFLALLYALLFLPVLALLIKQAVVRVSKFSERVVIGLAGMVIFTDVSYISYFSSFYVEPMMYICFLLCIGSALALQGEKHNAWYLLVYTGSGILLVTAKNQCAIIGIFLGIMCVRFIFIKKGIGWRAGCAGAAFVLFLSMMISFSYIPTDFTQESKYHAMTRGVLLQASDPEKTLAEFGIDGAYAILTDTNSNDSFPFISPSDTVLEKAFYDQYNTSKILYYYLKHPKAMLAMLDISVKAAFDVRRSVSGNYEKAVGMPKMAKSLFFSMASNFKVRSAPRTIGYIILLIIGIVLLFRQHVSSKTERSSPRVSIGLETMLLVLLIGLSQAILTIVNSGDSELSQHLFLFSVAIDVVSYFCFAEVLHKLHAI